jgi:hypothetical protein
MTTTGFHEYQPDEGETVTFAVEPSSVSVLTVTASVDGGLAQELPIDIGGDGARHRVAITAAFSSDGGGRADILVSGSDGGEDHQPLSQPGTKGSCTEVFVVKEERP